MRPSLTASYDTVMEHFDDQVERKILDSIRRELSRRNQRLATTCDAKELLQQMRPPLLEAAGRVEQWTLDGDGFECLEDGLRDTYRRARKAMRRAQRASFAGASSTNGGNSASTTASTRACCSRSGPGR